MISRLFPLLFLVMIQIGWGAGRCGFAVLAEGQFGHGAPGLARMQIAATACLADYYYDDVFVDTTSHFRIFYTLTGPHAVSGEAYIDTLKVWLEKAWILHTDSLKMEAPQGPSMSYHYQDSRYPNKYPVEVIDLGMVRGGSCEGCYGLTLPDNENTRLSTLLMENDFMYAPYWAPTAQWNGCNYRQANTPITSAIQGVQINYSEQWNLALRVTTAHELYHGVQLRYQDYMDHYHFWFESSAVGIEELAAPDLNDYLQYLPTSFSNPGNSLLDSSVGSLAVYSQAPLHHYFRHRLGLAFDVKIWERLSQNPQRGIAYIMDDEVKSKGLSGFPDFYSDFIVSLLPAGNRTVDANPDLLWDPDLPLWPEIKLQSLQSTADIPSQPFSYGLYSADALSNWVHKEGSQLTKQVVSLEDSTYVLVTTGFSPNVESSGEVSKNIAYPNPWRGSGDVLFQVMEGSEIEVRDASGLQILRLPVDGVTRLARWKELDLKHRAPGVYYWRGSNDRMLHRILVIR